MSKAFINLPIIHNNPKERFTLPTLEDKGDRFLVTWNYQATSQAIQGRWCKWSRSIPKSEYNFEQVFNDLTEFIKIEYKVSDKGGYLTLH